MTAYFLCQQGEGISPLWYWVGGGGGRTPWRNPHDICPSSILSVYEKNGLAFLLILHSVILQFYNVTGFKYALPRCNAQCRFRWERNIFNMELCPSSRWSCSSKRSTLINTIQSQHCITLVQRWTNVFDVGTTLYKCYTDVLCLLEYVSFIAGDNIVFLWWDDARWAVGTCCRTTRCNQAANLWPRS